MASEGTGDASAGHTDAPSGSTPANDQAGDLPAELTPQDILGLSVRGYPNGHWLQLAN